jgi:hypothetical protein
VVYFGSNFEQTFFNYPQSGLYLLTVCDVEMILAVLSEENMTYEKFSELEKPNFPRKQ